MKTFALALCLLSTCAADVAAQCVASTPVQPVVAPGQCKPGYVLQYGVLGEECYDNYARTEDALVLETGIVYSRDGHGNIEVVWQIDATGTTSTKVAAFGDYDSYGRPGWYFDPALGPTAGLVTLTWPDGGGCQYDAMTTNGWSPTLTWDAPLRAATIRTTPKERYAFNYYPDGAMQIASSDLLLYGYRWQVTRAYSQAGEQIGYNQQFAPITPPTTSAALPAEATPATPPDPFFKPKVITRPLPGGAIGPRLLGPLSLLYPTFDYLGKQIGRFYVNAMAISNQALDDQCAAQLHGDYLACRKFWTDRGLNPDNLPTDDLKIAHITCAQSARSRHAACMAGERPLLLNLPWPGLVGNQASIDCFKQHADDKAACRVAADAKYALLGPLPTLYQVDLYGCILSAQRRLAQCQAGQPLSPLELPR